MQHHQQPKTVGIFTAIGTILSGLANWTVRLFETGDKILDLADKGIRIADNYAAIGVADSATDLQEHSLRTQARLAQLQQELSISALPQTKQKAAALELTKDQ